MIATNLTKIAKVADRFALGLVNRNQSAIRPALLSPFQNITGGCQYSSIIGVNVTPEPSFRSAKEVLRSVNLVITSGEPNPVAAFDVVTRHLPQEQKESLAADLGKEWHPSNRDIVEEILQERGGIKGQAFVDQLNANQGTAS